MQNVFQNIYAAINAIKKRGNVMGFFANVDIPVLIAFLMYLAAMLGIGFYFTNKSKKMSDYFLAEEIWQLGNCDVCSSIRHERWLLMGLPGAAYATGMGNYWIAIGLAIGTILNWAFEAFGRFTEVADLLQFLNAYRTDLKQRAR